MMTKIEKFQKLFTCKECLNLLKDPILLPCMETVCGSHSVNICAKSCLFCDQKHIMPENGFISNKIVKEMIELEVNNITLVSKSFDKSLTTLEDIAGIIEKTCGILKDPKNFIDGNFFEIRTKVKREFKNVILKLENWSQKIEQEIDEAESRCFEKINDIDSVLNSDEVSEEKLNFQNLFERLEDFQIDEKKFEDVYHEGCIMKKYFEGVLTAYSDHLLNGHDYIFESVSQDLTSSFGRFMCRPKSVIKFDRNFFMESDILNNASKTALIKVCEFQNNQKWKLIYKGSVDGFSPKDFHKRCDSVEKTITILKSSSGNIFGGYTDKAWSSSEGYVEDNNAFLFNLVNSNYQPLRIKCVDPKHAIFNHKNFGPKFGKSRRGKTDLSVLRYENLRGISYMGESYKVPGLNSKKKDEMILLRSYLAGSDRFTIEAIEIYCKLNQN